ncbi:MAG TPA: DUF3187 family protein, partial [Gammaproteobacteria bacterium]
VYGLPPPQDARLPESGDWSVTGVLNISNTLNIQSSANNSLFIDGETRRLNLVFGRTLGEDWRLSALLPWVEHTAGTLDRSIDRYHELFGLREGDRPGQPRDRLLFSYRHAGKQVLLLDSVASGIGDIQLILDRQLRQSPETAYSLSANIKFPSGDADKLTGSGATDIGVWTTGYWKLTQNVDSSAALGLLLPGKGEILDALQMDQVAFGNAGLQLQAASRTVLKAQLDWHTRFYEDTGIDFLGDALQFACGATWSITPGIELDFAIAEDIRTEASPDVNFIFSVRTRSLIP